jgi:hypothetical protein
MVRANIEIHMIPCKIQFLAQAENGKGKCCRSPSFASLQNGGTTRSCTGGSAPGTSTGKASPRKSAPGKAVFEKHLRHGHRKEILNVMT